MLTDKQDQKITQALSDGDTQSASFIQAYWSSDTPLKNGETIFSYAIKMAEAKLSEQVAACTAFSVNHVSKLGALEETDKNVALIHDQRYDMLSEIRRAQDPGRKVYSLRHAAMRFSFEPLLKRMNIDPSHYPENVISESPYNELTAAHDEIIALDHAREQSLAVAAIISQENKGAILYQTLQDSINYAQPILEENKKLFEGFSAIRAVLDKNMTDKEFMAVHAVGTMNENFPYLKDYQPTPQEFLAAFDAEEDGAPPPQQKTMSVTESWADEKEASRSDDYQQKQKALLEEQQEQSRKRQREDLTRQELAQLQQSGFFEWRPECVLSSFKETLAEIEKTAFLQEMKQKQERKQERSYGKEM